MRESEIEKHLIKECKRIGASCEKFKSPNNRGVPDRIVCFRGEIFFIELKAPNKWLSSAQKRDIERRRKLGMLAGCFNSKETITEFINLIANNAAYIETLPAFNN